MKRMTANIFCMLFLFSIPGSYCQEFEYGIKIGTALADINHDKLVVPHINIDKPDIWKHDFDVKAGLNFSVIIGYTLSPKMYFGIEPGYIKKGAVFTSSDSKLDLNYWNLPVVFKYSVSNSFGIYAGPEFSKLISAELDFDGIFINMDSFYNKQIETSVLLGVEYQMTRLIGLGMRYNYGITKVSKTKWFDEQGSLIGVVKENSYYLSFYAALVIK